MSHGHSGGPMKYSEIVKRLRGAGTAQNRKVYARHGVQEPMFGVSYGELGKLEREVKKACEPAQRHDVAIRLWESGNHDARILAARLADPRALRSRELDRWVGGVSNYAEASAFAGLVSRGPLALSKSKKWSASPREFVGQAGWNVLTNLLVADADLDDAFLADRLAVIEAEVHCARNRVRYAMNNTLIQLGLRSPEWRKRCLAAAQRIGAVEVDHGDTGCKTPDAAASIRKAVRHRREMDRRRRERAAAREAQRNGVQTGKDGRKSPRKKKAASTA
ncbi:MAG: DNA alkylation repair protein [Acidobacteriota bacterium]